ncbi:hypothetical protein DYBT9275_02905 [Dyadobacter sp. CECT 9275]|uniref:Uncharacterized protein n=1 Tax=Dyadobacter helix TaxID=2822344 RepID=A0A916JCG6_9BACT|nr:hypothetical protein [Dyadobacter sp. CECT 9275]CAG5002494.1 hypothetical protein DYBT9275_02905 [Dyadobacter sp. CECT 9275]
MYSRREFVRRHSLKSLGLLLAPFVLPDERKPKTSFRFISPVDGDMLHSGDGIATNGTLKTKVKISAPAHALITVNGRPAVRKGNIFTSELMLDQYKNIIEARNTRTGESKTITIYWLPNLVDRYRLSIDDAIWFLKDIHLHASTYQSLFENPFMGFLKELHDQFGTKVHINIFYETEGFNLSQMTDKFRNEWIANASWLRLSFHAKAEFPDNPYRNAGYHQVKQECEQVISQIRRFAGAELDGPVTTLHWGEVPVEVSRALRDAGYKGQLCDFNVDDDLPPCSYYLSVEQRRHMNKRFVWRDNQEDIIFIKSSVIIDTMKIEGIVPHLERYGRESRRQPYTDLLVHEQYFYPYYRAYQPNYRDKVLKAVTWAHDNGYRPAFLSDCIFG